MGQEKKRGGFLENLAGLLRYEVGDEVTVPTPEKSDNRKSNQKESSRTIEASSYPYITPIALEPRLPEAGEGATVVYRGYLSDGQGGTVYMHWGTDNWKSTTDALMQEKGNGEWQTAISVPQAQELNVCFRDAQNRWDNNYGANWNFVVETNQKSTH